MSVVPKGKLNQLQQLLPEGLMVDAAWLERKGYPSSLRNRYVQSGWLESLARGVYRRPPPHIRAAAPADIPWTLVVVSLQALMEWPGIVGGRTALNLQGFSHYIQSSEAAEVHLYGETPAPAWTRKLLVTPRFVFHPTRRIFDVAAWVGGLDAVAVDVASGVTRPIPKGFQPGPPVSPWPATSWPITCSTPERAIMELLDEVPDRETFYQADAIFQSLGNLNPRRCQRLLETCHNVKVKRLFLWFAKRHQPQWLRMIDRTAIHLGTGKRHLASGGYLDREFQITVPRDLDATE